MLPVFSHKYKIRITLKKKCIAPASVKQSKKKTLLDPTYNVCYKAASVNVNEHPSGTIFVQPNHRHTTEWVMKYAYNYVCYVKDRNHDLSHAKLTLT